MSADTRQVDGSHYQSEYQHWNFSADCRLGGFEHTITKYFQRHRLKNGLRDVLKGEHNLEKLLEISRLGFVCMNDGATVTKVHRFFAAHPEMDELDRQVYLCVVFWSKPKHIEAALNHVKKIKEAYAQADAERERNERAKDYFGLPDGTPDSGAHPTPGGYVDQGKDTR
jgi:hypothetical protein